MNKSGWTGAIRPTIEALRKLALPLSAMAAALLLPESGAHGEEAASANQSRPNATLVGDPSLAIAAGRTLTVSFANVMVPASEIDSEAKNSPIVFVPEVRGQFLWKSQTEGEFTFSAVPPGTKFKIMLAPGLVDLAGKAVTAGKPGEPLGIRSSEDLTMSSNFEQNPIDRRPSVDLTFSEDVNPSDLAETAWFQDRDSRKRYPAEVVVLRENEAKAISAATVTPRADLPPGRTFDLIVDGVKDAATGTPMKRPFAKALGETQALKVVKVAAFNYPMKSPRITVQFSEAVHPEQGRQIKIDPAVDVKCVASGDELWLEGAFDIHQRYRVTVPTEIIGKRGFGMAEPSVWHATFHAKKPSLIFPTEDLHQRSRLGLHFGFIQVNTGPLQWRLARVPPEKLLAINVRLREFTDEQVDPVTSVGAEDPETGLPIWKSSESLIDASHLDIVAQGQIDASPTEADTRREISWKPDRGLAAGAYVLEVTGKIANGKTLANRALITFTEFAATQKRVNGNCLVRVTQIANGQPVAGMRVRAMGLQNESLAEAVTDRNGVAEFDRRARVGVRDQDRGKAGAEWFYLETADGPVLESVQASRFGESGFDNAGQGDEPDKYRLVITSDRPIYRPGQTLKLKGFVREVAANGTLRVPHAHDVAWQITGDEGPVADGSTKLDGYGGFEAEWPVPASLPVGTFQIGATFQGISVSQDFGVQEFRPPPFLVSLADLKLNGAEAGVRVSSAYFHGAPNAGAHVRWQALWTAHQSGDARVIVTDRPRPTSAPPEATATVKGEGTLTPDGALEIKVKPPFKDGVTRGWYELEWSAEVTAVDGQTIAEKANFPFFAVPVELSATASQSSPREGEANPFIVSLTADSKGIDQQPLAGTPLSVELYHALTKSVKEEIAPNVYRYRNSVTYEKDQTTQGHTPFHTELHVRAPGDYLVIVRDAANAKVPPAIRQVYVAGQGDAEFPLSNEESIGVTCDRKMDDSDPQSGYVPGEKATISVQAPFSGLAWVSIEAEQILDTLFIPLDANSSRFELPVKKEYGPEAWVTVYLLHPGGDDHLPAERFGAVHLKVGRPDLALQVRPALAAKQVQPKAMISGDIVVNCEGRPVKGADLTVYAVDEAVLDAGDWHEPQLSEGMYPQRPWRVGTYQGLPHLSFGVDEASLHQKGFIVGAAGLVLKETGAAFNASELRTNFPPLAYWKTHLETNRDGKAPFSFQAPDTLTKYRVIALAQTKEGQFGTGSDAVELSKPVQLEPALPRFVRVGDEVELRVIVRQKMADELAVKVHCTTPLTLSGADTQEQNVRRGVPAVYRFHATVGERESAAVRFETDSGSRDAVEVTLPVHPPTLLRKEALFGTLEDVRKRIPEDWTKATGNVEATLSTSPWLPKLTGLPLLLEYPHGCFEQITSRILGYTVLADLLAYVPEPAARQAEYRKRIETGLSQIQSSLTEAGYLPYWPGGTASAYPTVAGFWSELSAIRVGLAVRPETADALGEATRAIARGDSKEVQPDPFCQAFALMVLSQIPGEVKTLSPVIREMYLRRETIGPDERALLAIAMHRFGIMPAEQQQLLREIDTPLQEHAFDPDNFGSTTRCEAIRALTFALVDPDGTSGKAREQLRGRIDNFLDSSQSLSTQENFWLLLAFQAMHPAAKGKSAPFRSAQPAPQAISPNGASALWGGLEIRKIQSFALRLDGIDALTCLMSAQFRTDSPVTARSDKGFRVERVTKNMTAPTRTGSAEAPYHLGDQILITYRLISPKLHHFVALEDELPAGLETVNPNIASIARTYSVPEEKGTRQLPLSHSELRDRVTYLYFDRVDPGIATYSVLARATCAGVFHWPATQAVPMYDSRFSGLSPSEICHISGD